MILFVYFFIIKFFQLLFKFYIDKKIFLHKYHFFHQLHVVSRTQLGRLLLRHSVSHIPPYSESIACWMAELNAVLCLRSNRNINLNKYFIFSSRDRTHKQSRLQSHFVPLCHDWPILPYFLCPILFVLPYFGYIYILPHETIF